MNRKQIKIKDITFTIIYDEPQRLIISKGAEQVAELPINKELESAFVDVLNEIMKLRTW